MRWYAEYSGWGCDRCRQFHPVAAAPRSRTALYLALGGGALAVLVIIVLAATSGDDEGGRGGDRRSRSRGTGGATYGFKGDSIDDAVTAMQDFTDRMCDCKKASCAEKVERDYKEFERVLSKKFDEREVEKLLSDKKLYRKIERLDEERKKCRDKAKKGDSSEILDMYERFADRACLCKDAECTRKVSDDMSKDMSEWAKRNAGSTADKPDPDLTKKLEVIMKRFTDCYTKAAMASSATPPDP
jgi:hypothetical protein